MSSSRFPSLLLLSFLLTILISFNPPLTKATTPPPSFCPNGCSGHGQCHEYTCKCDIPWIGDDCNSSPSSSRNSQHTPLPPFSQGHYNLTTFATKSGTFQEVLKKIKSEKMFKGGLIGFTSPSSSCIACSNYEPSYQLVTNYIDSLTSNPTTSTLPIVPFIRIDIIANPDLARLYGIGMQFPIPSLAFISKHDGKVSVYEGDTDSEAVISYIGKQLATEVYSPLDSLDEFDTFRVGMGMGDEKVSVIGVFTNVDNQEDEYEDFVSYCAEIQSVHYIYCGLTTSKDVISKYTGLLPGSLFPRTPVVVVTRPGEDHLLASRSSSSYGYSKGQLASPVSDFYMLDERSTKYDGISDFVDQNSLPTISFLNTFSFNRVVRLQLPMVMLFLDFTTDSTAGVLNTALISEFQAVAETSKMSDKLAFIVGDGRENIDKLIVLGVKGVESLPSITINSNDRRTSLFGESLPMNRDYILGFCRRFLGNNNSGAGEVVTGRDRMSKLNTLDRSLNVPKETVKVIKGVSERFDSKSDQLNSLINLTPDEFERNVMDEDKDIVVMFHKDDCEGCATLAPQYKRVSYRFNEIGIESLIIARVDLSSAEWVKNMHVLTKDHLPDINLTPPTILMLPSNKKTAPYLYFTGVGKVQQMMRWIEGNAGVKFALGELPHLNEKDKVAYKEQIEVRETRRIERVESQRGIIIEDEGVVEIEAETETETEKPIKKKKKRKKKKGESTKQTKKKEEL